MAESTESNESNVDPPGEAAESGASSSPTPASRDPRAHAALQRYWRANVSIMAVLLIIWAIVGLGCGVLFADALNVYKLGGIPLGFWFAQQGSIATFVILILIYCVLLNRLDDKHHEELARLKNEDGAADGQEGGGHA